MKKHIVTLIQILFLVLFLFLVLNGKMMIWLGLFAVSLILALFLGRLYCGYACPMNTLMIPTEWLSKKLNLQTKNTPKWLESGKLSWFFLALSVIIMIIGKRILKIDLPILLIWLILSVIITLRYRPAVFHNLICPFGALQRVFGRFAKVSKNVDKQTCIGCKICEKNCPTEAIEVTTEKKAEINTTMCLQCQNCQEVCPKNSIHYSKKLKEAKSWSKF